MLIHIVTAGSTSCTTAATSAAASSGLGGQLLTNSNSSLVPIFAFKAQYQLSEITSDIRERMTKAVASLLQVNTLGIVLSFASATLRNVQQQEFVLVRVGLVNFQGSTAAFASIITQENLNSEMAAMGIKSVELLTSGSEVSISLGTSMA